MTHVTRDAPPDTAQHTPATIWNGPDELRPLLVPLYQLERQRRPPPPRPAAVTVDTLADAIGRALRDVADQLARIEDELAVLAWHLTDPDHRDRIHWHEPAAVGAGLVVYPRSLACRLTERPDQWAWR